MRDDGSLGSRCPVQDGKTWSDLGSVFELEAACLANRLDASGKERAIMEGSWASVLSSWVSVFVPFTELGKP